MIHGTTWGAMHRARATATSQAFCLRLSASVCLFFRPHLSPFFLCLCVCFSLCESVLLSMCLCVRVLYERAWLCVLVALRVSIKEAISQPQ